MEQKLKANQKKQWFFTGQASTKGTASSDQWSDVHNFGANAPNFCTKKVMRGTQSRSLWENPLS